GATEFCKCPLPKHRKCLVTGDGQEPRRNLALALEASGLAPNIEEHLAECVRGQALVPRETLDKAIDPGMVPGIEALHRELVAAGNQLDESLVGSLLGNKGLTMGESIP